MCRSKISRDEITSGAIWVTALYTYYIIIYQSQEGVLC